MDTQIFILSKLMEGNTYPYKIKKQLSDPVPLDQLGGVTESKLYYHFDSLVKQGLIEIVEIIKEEHRPDKQVFGIMTKGREELPKKIYKVFENADTISEMVVGLLNIKYVDRDKVVEILEKKLKIFIAHWEHIMDFDKQIQVDKDKENLKEFLGGYISTRTEHTISWLEELIKRIQQMDI
ncbi:helix-turn-helix transcriptional regulator [Peribacillus huizhouensis]|uniref:DNA-binding PadR family transcriptional regulator n=1 Tax=Peribacillus huizhouensis TaxID=1501239 RepID=A0ABR6CPB5_9BACI|nr:helix-turn-helix transcriptional regulator [Peribacillus huizhouensis]MBA9026503.1 DNA-binding PadR family transcriptional regulator [Peribacillus huizhouensis]